MHRLFPCVLELKAIMKTCRSDLSILCLDMLCMQLLTAVWRGGSALPSSSLSLSREAEGFSAIGVGPGLEEGEEREREWEREKGEKNKTKQIYWLCTGSLDTLVHCFTEEKSATPCHCVWNHQPSNCQSGLKCENPSLWNPHKITDIIHAWL